MSTAEIPKPLHDLSKLKQKVLGYFSNLDFNSEKHSYKYRDRTLSSVSSIIKKYVEPVDFVQIAKFVAIRETKLRGYKVTQAMILQEWEDKKNNACNQGNKAHSFGEIYEKGKVPNNNFEKAIVAFWDSIPDYIYPFLFELQMFSEELGIAGTADIILYNSKTRKFIIADYKTNEDLFKNHKGKKLMKPFDFLLDSPFGKYTIQLSLYQYLFEQIGFDFQVESRKIVWLKPDGTFEIFNTQDCRSEIIKELKKKK
jgi:hypothetical protein